MSKSRCRRGAPWLTIALLTAWPAPPLGRATEIPEPLVVPGVPGRSVAHVVIDVRSIASSTRPIGVRIAAQEADDSGRTEALRPWHSLPLPPGARVRLEAQSAPSAIDQSRLFSPPLASSFGALGD